MRPLLVFFNPVCEDGSAQGRFLESLFGGRRPAGKSAVDTFLENMTRAENKHPPRLDRHFFTRLRIAPHPPALLADRERTERRKLHRVALGEAVGNLGQHKLDEFRRLVPRQTDFLIDRLAQMRARDCFPHGLHL